MQFNKFSVGFIAQHWGAVTIISAKENIFLAAPEIGDNKDTFYGEYYLLN